MALAPETVGALAGVAAATIAAGPAWVALWRRNNRDHATTALGLGLVLDLLSEVRAWQEQHTAHSDHVRRRIAEAAQAVIEANPAITWPPVAADLVEAAATDTHTQERDQQWIK